MTLSNGKIERIAVDAITTIANKPGSYLIPRIPVGDKEISFDGGVSVLIDDSEKRESLEGIVPVQVKGTLVNDFHEGFRTYSLDMAHYRNYFKNDGVLLLLVEVKVNGETNIFYKSLLSMELSEIIEQFGHQQSRTVELRPLDETNLYSVCRKFLNEQKFQPKMLVEKKPFTYEAFPAFTFTSLTFNPEQHETRSIFEHDFTIYGVLNQTLFPLQSGRIASMAKAGLTRFNSKNQHYDLFLKLIIEEHKNTLIIENVFSVITYEISNNLGFRFLCFHSLAAQLKAIPFALHLLSGHSIEFEAGTIALDVDASKVQDELQVMYKHEQDLKELVRVFHILGIKETTVFQETDDMDLYSSFQALIQAVLHNQIARLNLENPKIGSLINLHIGDKVIVLFYSPNGEYLLSNAFSEDMLKMKCIVNGNAGFEPFPHSFFTMMNNESLAHGINFNTKIICESFDQFDPFLHATAFGWTNEFCLKCIRAYDQCGNLDLLDVANYIYEKYPGALPNEEIKDNDPIIIINKHQIQKRKDGYLTEKEKNQLFQLKLEAMKNNLIEMLFCINVLLENRFESDKAYQQLESGKQDFYQTLPIFTLYQNLS